MIALIKMALGNSDPEVVQALRDLVEHNLDSLTEQETRYLNELIKDHAVTGQMSHPDTFLRNHPELKPSMEHTKPITPSETQHHIAVLLNKRNRQRISTELMTLANDVLDDGVTYDVVDKLHSIQPETPEDEEGSELSLYERYKARKEKSLGIVTGIPEIDNIIGGIPKGHVACIMGYTGQYKSTWALNMIHHNSYDLGYNQLLISLEMPKEDIQWNLLSLHSTLPKFSQYVGIEHDKIRKGLLSDEEEKYLFEVVEPDLRENSKGKIIILDETDFKTQSFGEIRTKIEEADEQCEGGLDVVYHDHVGLYKYAEHNQRNLSTGETINRYVSFIRQLSIRFRRDKESPKEWRKLTSVVLVQANRQGHQKAVKNNGRYTLMAISEANEVERACSTILASYTTEEMKLAKEASVQLLKSRYGQTIYEPINVYADPVYAKFGEEEQQDLSGENMDAMFDSLMNVNPSEEGFGSAQTLNLDEFDI